MVLALAAATPRHPALHGQGPLTSTFLTLVRSACSASGPWWACSWPSPRWPCAPQQHHTPAAPTAAAGRQIPLPVKRQLGE